MRLRLFQTLSVVVIVAAAAAAIVFHSAGNATAAKTTYVLDAELTGAAEIPGPGDPDGSGRATIIVRLGNGELCYRLWARKVDPLTAAHIHRGTITESGPVVVNLSPPNPTARGCIEGIDGELLNEIATNPEGFYVNVHNPAFQPGALRGQLAD